MLHTILIVFAFVLFVIAAIGRPDTGRYNLVAAGLACWVLSLFVDGVVQLH